MTATATTVSARGSISRILALGAGALISFVLGAAIALAATGWFAGETVVAPKFDATNALHEQVLREYAAPAAASPAFDSTNALRAHVLRENGAR